MLPTHRPTLTGVHTFTLARVCVCTLTHATRIGAHTRTNTHTQTHTRANTRHTHTHTLFSWTFKLFKHFFFPLNLFSSTKFLPRNVFIQIPTRCSPLKKEEEGELAAFNFVTAFNEKEELRFVSPTLLVQSTRLVTCLIRFKKSQKFQPSHLLYIECMTPPSELQHRSIKGPSEIHFLKLVSIQWAGERLAP